MFKTVKSYFKTRRWQSITLQIALFVLIFFAISLWQTRNAAKGIAPDFTAQTITGETLTLGSFRGKPLLLHFWATWCPICKLEQNTISSIYDASIDNDFQVLTIASWSGSASEVADYIKTNDLPFPVLIDENGSLAHLYGVQGVPGSFIIDSSGVIHFVEQGYTTEIGLRLRLWWLKNT